MILDIGPETARAYAEVLARAPRRSFSTGRWASTRSLPYQNGTRTVGEAIARATAGGAVSVVGGGDAAAAAHNWASPMR